MKSRVELLMKLRRILLPTSPYLFTLHRSSVGDECLFSTLTTCSTICQTQVEKVRKREKGPSKERVEFLRSWGFNDDDMAKIFRLRPSLTKANETHLQSRFELLTGLGVHASDLQKMVNWIPRFLTCRVDICLDKRLELFMTLFGSREVLAKAIVRNPSLLTYNFDNKVKPVIALYEDLGLSKKDLGAMLLQRTAMIPRTVFNDEKVEYIRRTGLKRNDSMYKYVVTLIGVSRLETIREKIANFKKCGLTEDETFILFGRSPLMLTLSVEKVQRNMAFVRDSLKLPANAILDYPFLVYYNLENVLKPRVLIAEKMAEMGLELQLKGPNLIRFLRIKDERFLDVFICSQPKDVADELMKFYNNLKRVKKSAVASKKKLNGGHFFVS
ncbi:hypothetical protein UlMin_007516 [Ulmus minor]